MVAPKGTIVKALRHTAECDEHLGDERYLQWCNGYSYSGVVQWRGQSYFVLVPICRHNPTRRIIGTVEGFGCDVGWDGDGACRVSGIVRDDEELTRALQRWFPLMSFERRRALQQCVLRSCVPAANSGNVRGISYLWVRDIARTVRAAALLRGRWRCETCRRIRQREAYPDDRDFSRDWERAKYDTARFCSPACAKKKKKGALRLTDGGDGGGR